MLSNIYLYNFQFFNFLFISHFALQRFSKKVSCMENSCMAMKNGSSLYSVGCKSYTLLLDSRTLSTIKKIPPQSGGRGLYNLIIIKR